MVPGCRYSKSDNIDLTSRRNAYRVYGHSGSSFHAFFSTRYAAISFSEMKESGLIRGINLPFESAPGIPDKTGQVAP